MLKGCVFRIDRGRVRESAMTIKTCFFDMGNVLVFFSHERMCQNIAKLCGWNLPETKTFLLEEGRQWKLERGDISEEEFHAEFCEATGRKLDIDQLRHAAAADIGAVHPPNER